MPERFPFRRRRKATVAVGLVGCIAGGCAVERTTAVELIGGVTGDGGPGSNEGASGSSGNATSSGSGGASSSDSGGASSGSTETSTGSSGDGSGGAESSCAMASAACTVSNTGCNVGTYFLYDNQWNCGGSTGNHCGPESAYACVNSDGTVSWVVTSNQAAGNTAVLSYPAMQDTFNNVPIGSFRGVTSTFAETGPHVGIYEYAYDIWLNGVATAGSTQILVWVDTYSRVPSGAKVATTTFGGRMYDVWKTSDNHHIVLVSTVAFTSGTVDLLEILNWATAQGWLPSSSTLGQIDFGVEIASTGGASATYEVNAYSVATN